MCVASGLYRASLCCNTAHACPLDCSFLLHPDILITSSFCVIVLYSVSEPWNACIAIYHLGCGICRKWWAYQSMAVAVLLLTSMPSVTKQWQSAGKICSVASCTRRNMATTLFMSSHNTQTPADLTQNSATQSEGRDRDRHQGMRFFSCIYKYSQTKDGRGDDCKSNKTRCIKKWWAQSARYWEIYWLIDWSLTALSAQ